MARIFALLIAVSAQAAETKPPVAAVAAEATPQGRAFAALAEDDRKAAQEALGWLGFYNGVDDGAYGKRTIDAFVAYQRNLGAPADGVMTSAALAALKQGAAKAKAAVGFRPFDDPATGVRIGAPLKLLEKRDSGAGTAALTSKDGAIGLYLRETPGPLAALYKTMSADAAARKVTYKYMKPDAFFVTAGEEGDNKFYRRYAVSGDKLRGFAFLYPKKRAKALDPVALAIANTFEPFPSTSTPTPPERPAPPPEPPKLAATAFVVAPNVAVTALDAAQCKAPTIAGKPVRFLAPLGRLARLGGDFGGGATAPPPGAGSGELLALSLTANGGKTALEAAPAQPLAGERVMAALGASASGAPLFDRQGRLVAFVASIAKAPSRAGVALRAPHETIAASAVGEAGPSGDAAALTAAEIAKLRRSAILGVFCAS